MVIFCVIQNHIDPSARMATGFSELFEKSPKSISIKHFLFSLVHKFSISKTHCTIIPNTFSGGVMQQNGFFYLRRHPHPTSRPVLLKMNLIQRPHVSILIGNQTAGFFLKAFCSSSLARAINERGFLSRKLKCLKRRWHCRTPKVIPNSV